MNSPKQTAWDCALRYLGQRNHGSAELRTKLGRRGFEEEEIAEAMQRLDDADLLDDAAFANDYARSLLINKHLSKRAAARKMCEKEVPMNLIEAVLTDYSDEDELGRAKEVASRRFRQMSGVDKTTAKRRLLAFLARRGYSQGICYQAIKDIFDEL